MQRSAYEKYEIIQSKCELEKANNCCGGKIFQLNLPDIIEFVDVKGDSNFTNNYSTAVFKEPKTLKLAEWMDFAIGSRCDEFDFIVVNGEKVVRMWWD